MAECCTSTKCKETRDGMQVQARQAQLQAKSTAPPSSTKSSQQGPFSFHPSRGNTSRHHSPPAAQHTTQTNHGSPTSMPPVDGSVSYAPSFTASQIHPPGTNGASPADDKSIVPQSVGGDIQALTRHVLADARQVR